MKQTKMALSALHQQAETPDWLRAVLQGCLWAIDAQVRIESGCEPDDSRTKDEIDLAGSVALVADQAAKAAVKLLRGGPQASTYAVIADMLEQEQRAGRYTMHVLHDMRHGLRHRPKSETIAQRAMSREVVAALKEAAELTQYARGWLESCPWWEDDQIRAIAHLLDHQAQVIAGAGKLVTDTDVPA